jgi:hypothetical protein
VNGGVDSVNDSGNGKLFGKKSCHWRRVWQKIQIINKTVIALVLGKQWQSVMEGSGGYECVGISQAMTEPILAEQG